MQRLRQKKLPYLTTFLTLLFLALLARPGLSRRAAIDYIEGDASCSDLAPAGVIWHEMKVSSVNDGSYSKGPLTVALNVQDGNDGDLINWSSNLGIDAVFLKGGPGGNFYPYRPPGSQATSDSGLTTPTNPGNGNHYPPNYLLFCTTTSLTPPTPTPSPTLPATDTPTPSATVPSPTPSATVTASTTPAATSTGTPTTTPTVFTATPSPTATRLPDLPSPRVYSAYLCSGCTASPGEPNDTCKVSRSVQPGLTYDFYPDDLHDWYSFRLDQPAELEIRVENFVPLAGQLAAYRGDNCEDATFLKNYGMSEPDKMLLLGQQPPGLYYIYVSNDGIFNSDEPYQLHIDAR